jgi:selenocysteine lyase/cysteine desulfurase
MKSSRRRFVQRLASLTGAGLMMPFWKTAQGNSLLEQFADRSAVDASTLATDEDFWYQVKMSYTVSPTLMNLNNGGVSPQPRVVQEAVERYNRLSNETPSYYMWRVLDKGREPLRQKLAQLAGCSAEELAIDRNSSEALETVIFGLRLQAGDEVVLSKMDYPNMINAWKQREHRDGVVLKWVEPQLPSEDDTYLSNVYTDAFSERTKVVHLTHVVNWTGQVLPVAQIAKKAKARGIEVLVDGAHSFAHLDFKIPDLACDYFGTSLHKWLCAPFGSGLLYVRKEKIKNLYPLLAAPDPESDDIRKFEHLGTRSFAIEQATGQAIDFHHMIGSDRKEARLQYLRRYWTQEAAKLPDAFFFSADENGSAIANIGFKDRTAQELQQFLFQSHKIHTVGIKWEYVDGVRITPNVYTVKRDLDRLLEALHAFATS